MELLPSCPADPVMTACPAPVPPPSSGASGAPAGPLCPEAHPAEEQHNIKNLCSSGRNAALTGLWLRPGQGREKSAAIMKGATVPFSLPVLGIKTK